ncbi:MAG: DNA mismatch repair protein MutS [Clostridia bacterium]|nr:DNA mismatch repair protein MutS [Clostridia bacterium]
MAKAPKLSPMMEHYKALKEKYADAILMYRLGDFYEMFFDDAIEASKILDLTLTGRDCGLEERAPMCGVPFHAVDGYISKLVKSGKKVAICEQLTAPGDQKGMVKRDVIRVITPGTVTDDEMLDATANSYLLALTQKKSGVGMAWADVSTGEIYVRELPSSANLEDIVLSISPSEIITDSQIYSEVLDYESVSLTKLPRPQSYYDYAFDKEVAEKSILSFYGINNLVSLGIDSGSLSVCALGGLLDYIGGTQKRKLNHMRAPQVIRLGDRMFIDFNTKRNLELTKTLYDSSKVGSLYWVLDRTRTSMGARALRKAIDEPYSRIEDINARLDGVEELFKNAFMREQLGEALSSIHDVERLCNRIAYGTISPRGAQSIAFSLKKLIFVKDALKKAKTMRLGLLREIIDPLEDLANYIMSALVDTPPITVKDGGIFREGFNEELDSYKNANKSAKRWLAEYEAKEREATGIKQLKVGYNRVFGYYIEVSNSNIPLVPYRFERKQTLTTGERYITDELKKMEEVILGAEEKALALETKLFGEIKQSLSEVVAILQTNSNAVAELDLLYSLATTSVINGYVRPKVSDKNDDIVIKEGRHPVVEALKRNNSFVPNDVVMTSDSRTLIITGPNMAGKSTYMRQVALIVLMAHIGCFVPAKEAEISLVDRIFTRVGASDNVAYGQSTFMVEMSEMANIINNATSKSLLILDEIGRGTSTLDGLSIAWAIVEHIALKLKAKTLFATHYHELSELEISLPALKNYHILIKDTGGKIAFLYKIARGGANKSFGIEVASLAGVNAKIIERAKSIMSSIEASQEGNLSMKVAENFSEEAIPTAQIGFFQEDSKYEELKGIINDIDLDSITPLHALTILSNLQKLTKPVGKRKK